MNNRENAKRWVEQWKAAAPLLEEQRERDIRASDTVRDLPIFDDVLDYALAQFPSSDSAGMIEMQRHFRRSALKGWVRAMDRS